MHGSYKFVSALFLTAALAACGSAISAATPQDASVQVRVFDPNHHDYHNWDASEDHYYRGYLASHHESYRPYDHQNHKQQQNYWKWRHNHPDHN